MSTGQWNLWLQGTLQLGVRIGNAEDYLLLVLREFWSICSLFFQNCQYDFSGGFFNPYNNYSIAASQAHQIVSANLNSYWGECDYYIKPVSSLGNQSLREVYEDVYELTTEATISSSCMLYGGEVFMFTSSQCGRKFTGLFLIFLGTISSGILAFVIVYKSSALIPNLYRIHRAEKLHRSMLRKLELFAQIKGLNPAERGSGTNEDAAHSDENARLIVSWAIGPSCFVFMICQWAILTLS